MGLGPAETSAGKCGHLPPAGIGINKGCVGLGTCSRQSGRGIRGLIGVGVGIGAGSGLLPVRSRSLLCITSCRFFVLDDGVGCMKAGCLI